MFATVRKFVLVVFTSLVMNAVGVAQNNRTAVSVNGSDAASCTVPDPCRTFAVALSKTNPNGEVVALTSGGYGPFTIDKPATIVAAPGIYAALVAASGDAIHVNAGAGARVAIRGLHLYGMSTGNVGISATGSAEEVHVEHCVIDGFNSHGISASLNVRVSDTTIRRCGGNGIFIDNATTAVIATIDRVELRDMAGNGVLSQQDANVTVRDSVATDCSGGAGFQAAFGGVLNLENSLATNSFFGVFAQAGGTIRVSNTMATDNGTGFSHSVTFPGTFVSWGNNKVRGNTTDMAGTITVVTQD